MLPETARIFLETSSIRGVGKVFKTQSPLLSRMWGIFVLGSTSFLFYSVFKITLDYLQYDVNIQTYQEIDDETPFPAVSICNNQPFSVNAYQRWSNKQSMSPTEFNKYLRQQALSLVSPDLMRDKYRDLQAARDRKDSKAFRQIHQSMFDSSVAAMTYSLIYDNLRMYYQNMLADEAMELGHTRNESIVDCIFKYGSIQVLGTRGCHDDMVKVKTFSDPNFFNCLSVEFTPEYAMTIISITLIVWLGPDDSYDIRHRQSFLNEVYEQAYGLRVDVHEPKTQPRVLEQGIQTEPGKMNEIKYQPIRFERKDTPKNPCISLDAAEKQKFRDLRMEYNYDFELCLNSKVQEVVLNKCGCMYIELPRIAMPNKTHPYCGFMDEKFKERSQCVKSLDMRTIRKSFEGKDCFPKCVDLSFEKELSTTKWRETKWMLHWIKELCERWDKQFKQLSGSNASEFEESLTGVTDYLTRDNITDLRSLGNSTSKASFDFDDRFSFIVVKRQSNNTFVKTEKIVLTLNALFSRVGGLCSMYIGLTLTFIMEFIEFIFRLASCDKSNDKTGGNGGDDGGRSEAKSNQSTRNSCRVVEVTSQDNGAPENQSLIGQLAGDTELSDSGSVVLPGSEHRVLPDNRPDFRHDQVWVKQADSRV